MFALSILIMFPFRKQLPVTHCCLDCSEVPYELHHGECSLQVSFTMVVIIAVCNPGRVTWSCVLFYLAWSLYAKIEVLVLSSSFMMHLCFCTPSAAFTLHAFSIKLCKLLHWGVRQFCCALMGVNKIFVKIY